MKFLQFIFVVICGLDALRNIHSKSNSNKRCSVKFKRCILDSRTRRYVVGDGSLALGVTRSFLHRHTEIVRRICYLGDFQSEHSCGDGGSIRLSSHATLALVRPIYKIDSFHNFVFLISKLDTHGFNTRKIYNYVIIYNFIKIKVPHYNIYMYLLI